MKAGKYIFLLVFVILSLAVSQSFAEDAYLYDIPIPQTDTWGVRVGVMEFQSSTIDIVPEQAISVGNNFTLRLAAMLPENMSIVGHGQLSTIASRYQLSTEGYVSLPDAVKIGRLAGCKYIISGLVTDLKTRSASTGVNLIVQLGRKVEVANAAVDIKVIDVDTGEVILSLSDHAIATQKNSTFSIIGVDSGRNDINGKEAAAVFLLTSRLTLKVIEAMTGEYPKVTAVNENEILFNIGTKAGARKDLIYRVYTDSSNEENIAVVKVTEAYEDSSKAVIYNKKNYGKISLIRVGDRIFPTDLYEVRPIVKNKTFVSSRPQPEEKKSGSTLTPIPEEWLIE